MIYSSLGSTANLNPKTQLPEYPTNEAAVCPGVRLSGSSPSSLTKFAADFSPGD